MWFVGIQTEIITFFGDTQSRRTFPHFFRSLLGQALCSSYINCNRFFRLLGCNKWCNPIPYFHTILCSLGKMFCILLFPGFSLKSLLLTYSPSCAVSSLLMLHIVFQKLSLFASIGKLEKRFISLPFRRTPEHSSKDQSEKQ